MDIRFSFLREIIDLTMALLIKVALFAMLFKCCLGNIVEVNKCNNVKFDFKFLFNLTFFVILGDDIALPYQVDIANCTVQPCQVPRGSDATMIIDFFARKYIYILKY